MPPATTCGAWTSWHSTSLLLLVIALPVAIACWSRNGQAVGGWISAMAILCAFLAIAGHGTTGCWRGALIDSRNVISLSRLQMLTWTVIVLAGLATAVLWNIAWQHDEPLNVLVPKHLWLLMGISITSLVASPMLLEKKKNTTPNAQETAKTFNFLAKQGDDPAKLDTQGQVIVNSDPRMARWSDLFTGEETGNAGHLDLARMQMLFFTLVLALAYAASLYSMFSLAVGSKIEGLLDLDESMIALMAISHGGYLAGKAAPHSETEK